MGLEEVVKRSEVSLMAGFDVGRFLKSLEELPGYDITYETIRKNRVGRVTATEECIMPSREGCKNRFSSIVAK